MAERATIEPRLMHLLNESQSPDIVSRQLPVHPAPTLDYVSLPPIEVDSSGHRRANAAPQQIPPFCSIADDLPSRQNTRTDGPYRGQAVATTSASVLPPLLLVDDSESHQQRPALHLSYFTDPGEDAANKKRQRALTLHQDNPGPLPQPLKKQKSTQQVVPPIISGLHQPPQDAAVFPPIVGGHYDDAGGPSNRNAPKDYALVEVELPPGPAARAEGSSKPEKSSRGRPQRRAGKPRRKWSDEETAYLFLGVKRHGVGKWTKIVEDPDYHFDNRTAGDLKDRFRTCCPPEYRDEVQNKAAEREAAQEGSSQPQPKTSIPIDNILNGNILVNHDDLGERRRGPSSNASISNDSDSGGQGHAKPKSRAHRKNLGDLEALGIHGPFKKSERRARRNFTPQEDAEILDGIREYGASWSSIQRDARYNLSSRQPTDLRDRVRNKYPKLYESLEKGTYASIQSGRTTTKILEPPVNTPGWDKPSGSREPPPHASRASSRENMSRSILPARPGMADPMDSVPGWPGTLHFDMADAAPSSAQALTGEEMSISRMTHLVIEDAQGAAEHRHGHHGGVDEQRSPGPYGGRTTERQAAAGGTQQHEPPPNSQRGELAARDRAFKPWNEQGHHQN